MREKTVRKAELEGNISDKAEIRRAEYSFFI